MAQEKRSDTSAAQAVLPTSDLDADLRFFADVLGFRLDRVCPADAPRVTALKARAGRS